MLRILRKEIMMENNVYYANSAECAGIMALMRKSGYQSPENCSPQAARLRPYFEGDDYALHVWHAAEILDDLALMEEHLLFLKRSGKDDETIREYKKILTRSVRQTTVLLESFLID